MSSRRTLILVGAVIIGALSAFMMLRYVSGVEDESASNNQMIAVLVAKQPMSAGTNADEAVAAKAIVTANRRRADVPANAVTRSAEISGQIASLDLAGGEILTSAMFVSPEERTGSNASVLERGNVAMTVQVDTAQGVADLIRVGDSINIMARASVVSADPAVEGSEGGQGLSTVSGDAWNTSNPYVTVLQNVKVMAINNIVDAPKAATPVKDGEEAAAAPPQTANGLITVQLPPDQAQLLASVQSAGLYLTLNRPDYEPTPLPFVSDWPTFSGQLGKTPYPTAQSEAKGQ